MSRADALTEALGRAATLLARRPLREALPAEVVARAAVAALRAAARRPDLVPDLARRLREAAGRAPRERLSALVPPPAARAARTVLRLPLPGHRDLARRALGHPAVAQLVRDALVGALQDFTHRLATAGPLRKVPLRSLPRRIPGAGVLGGIEQAAERLVAPFVDEVLEEVLDRIADRLADPSRAAEHADLRVHLLDALLDCGAADLLAPLREADLDAAAAELAGALAELAQDPAVERAVRAAVEAGWAQLGDRALADLLAADELAALESALAERGAALLAPLLDDPAFADALRRAAGG